MVDLNIYRSHPDKELLTHTKQIHDNIVMKEGVGSVSAFASIFHDLGKMNPNFQEKLSRKHVVGYSNHSYLSTLAYLGFLYANQNILADKQKYEDILITLILIARHHGDIPDFPRIINEDEYLQLKKFIQNLEELPFSEFTNSFLEHKPYQLKKDWNYDFIQKQISTLIKGIQDPVNFFLSLKQNFSLLTLYDKIDASGYDSNKQNCSEFTKAYNLYLEVYLSKLKSDSDLNKTRKEIQNRVVKNIQEGLQSGNRLFSVTAPTGSGKTLMLLSLAGEILKRNSELRVIYTLPFLSITEQTDIICRKIFKDNTENIARIDSYSKGEEYDELIKNLDSNPQNAKTILDIEFAKEIFDHPFIITTFVRLFETLTTNKNSQLLKFSNLSNSIILIDEIQSLPPRLYGFFVVLLDYFSKKFNSFVILSSATMPDFALPENNKHELKSIFNSYTLPYELSDMKYFDQEIFNRYTIKRLKEKIDITELKNILLKEKKSVLVILNTISDTNELYEQMSKFRNNYDDIILLNTRFTLHDRKNKISSVKNYLDSNKRIILITTMLIEAGVDLDFPVLYRDICPIPNIVQSSGRCNRNGKLPEKGKVIVFELQKNNKSRSKLIYRGLDEYFLNYAKENLNFRGLNENKLFKIQKNYFRSVQINTIFGTHKSKIFKNETIDFVEEMSKYNFAEIGKFQLIDDNQYGEEYSYYIVQDNNDNNYEILEGICSDLSNIESSDYQNRKLQRIKLQNHIKLMSEFIVRLRGSAKFTKPNASEKPCCGISCISKEYYNSETGLRLSSDNAII